MFCARCGKEVQDGAAFCPGCGMPLQHDVTVPGQAEYVTVKKRDHKKVCLIAVAAVILIGVAFSIFLLFSTEDVVGRWDTGSGVILTIDRNHTGKIEDGEWSLQFDWEYNKMTHSLKLHVLGVTGELIYNASEDTLTVANGEVLHRIK